MEEGGVLRTSDFSRHYISDISPSIFRSDECCSGGGSVECFNRQQKAVTFVVRSMVGMRNVLNSEVSNTVESSTARVLQPWWIGEIEFVVAAFLCSMLPVFCQEEFRRRGPLVRARRPRPSTEGGCQQSLSTPLLGGEAFWPIRYRSHTCLPP